MSVIEKAEKADYSEAEIERLKLEMKLKLFEIQATVSHIQDDYAQLQAENQRLRAALEAAMSEYSVCPICNNRSYVVVNRGDYLHILYKEKIDHADDCIIGIALGLIEP